MFTYPYNITITYACGAEICADTTLSLTAATNYARELVKSAPEMVSNVEVIDNYTGEVVYTISAKVNVIVSVEIEEYNPYNA